MLATNFSKPAALFEKFPDSDVFIADKDGPDRATLKCRRISRRHVSVPWAGLAQAIGIERVGQEHADADEDEERRHDLGHSLPPCIAMPERARLRNSR